MFSRKLSRIYFDALCIFGKFRCEDVVHGMHAANWFPADLGELDDPRVPSQLKSAQALNGRVDFIHRGVI
jgi:hypothetical protein